MKQDRVTIRGIPFGILRKPDETIPYIVCARPSDLGPELIELPHHKRRQLTACAMCWADVWLDPVSTASAPNAKPICIDCVVKLTASMGKTQ